MDQDQQQPAEETSGSFIDTITNVFASPREAFGGIVDKPVRHVTWVIPFVATMLIMSVGIYLMFTHATFSQQMRDAQMAQFQKQVDAGSMTQEQADQIAESMGSGRSTMFMVIGFVAGSVFLLLYFVVSALFLWIASKFVLKAEAPYAKYLEAYGIASWIGIVGGIVTLVLMIGMDTIYASFSPSLAFLSTFDPQNTTHKLLKGLDLFAAWQAVTLGIGLSVIAKKPVGQGVGLAVGLWVVWVVLSVLLGLAR